MNLQHSRHLSIATSKDHASKVFECLWKMKKGDINGRAFVESAIRAVGKSLRHLSKHADLHKPEQVKDLKASKECSNGFKESLAEALPPKGRNFGRGL